MKPKIRFSRLIYLVTFASSLTLLLILFISIDPPLTFVFGTLGGIIATITGKLILSTNEEESARKKSYPGLSVLKIFRDSYDNSLSRSQLAIGLSIVGYIILMKVVGYEIRPQIVVIPFAFMILCIFYQLLISFRVRKGFYMTNEPEARNLTDFILSKVSDIDFKDPGKRKKILSDEELYGLLKEAEILIGREKSV